MSELDEQIQGHYDRALESRPAALFTVGVMAEELERERGERDRARGTAAALEAEHAAILARLDRLLAWAVASRAHCLDEVSTDYRLGWDTAARAGEAAAAEAFLDVLDLGLGPAPTEPVGGP